MSDDEELDVLEREERPEDLEVGLRDRQAAFFHRLGNIPPGNLSGLSVGAINHALAAPASGNTAALRTFERWGCIGPRNIGGAVRTLVQHPTDANTLYAGAAWGGVWKTVDAGNTWTPMGLAQDSQPVGALAIARTNPNILYIGTGEARLGDPSGTGLYQSVDAGVTFTRMAGTPTTPMPAAVGPIGPLAGAANRYMRIVVDPENPNRFWAASETGLWRFEPGTGFILEPVPVPVVAPNPAGTGIATDVAISIDPAEAAPPPGTPRRRLRIFVGMSGRGIFRGIFDRGTAPPNTVWGAAALPLTGGAAVPAALLFRIRLTICQGSPQFVYAMFGSNGAANRFRRSANGGNTWQARQTFAAAQSFYSMIIECHPTRPNTLVGGDLNLFRTANGGSTAWVRILNSLRYDLGDKAQHADQFAVVFDHSNPDNRVWVANDGGVSLFDSTVAPAVWRKRSFGIIAAMFNDITTHPTFPFMMGGGLQDNGSYASFGGPSWFHIDGGDGGTVAFDPVNPRRYYSSFATGGGGINEQAVLANPAAPLPPQPIVSVVVPDRAAPNNRMVYRFPPLPVFPAANPGLFVGLTVHHPRDANTLLAARRGRAFASVNGGTTYPTAVPNIAYTPPNADTSAMTFANRSAVAATDDWWIGNEFGEVFMSPNGAAGPWTLLAIPWPGGATPLVSSIAVHPVQSAVVAVSSAGQAGRVFLSHDRGANWTNVSGAVAVPTEDLPPGPVASLAWDPVNPQILYASTLAGVYVVKDLPAFAGVAALPAALPAAIHWTTFNEGLPLILVSDLETVPVTNTIRCGTFGRGIFEANTAASPPAFALPPVRLSIRSHVKDDGQRGYPAANTTPDDFRQFAVGPAAFDWIHAFDIRVDAPRFLQLDRQRFGETLDGVEFDEGLVLENPIAGEPNRVHVQVHNRGTAEASNVSVHLFFAAASAAVPPVAPPIVAADLNFPNAPTTASVWQRVDTPRTIGRLRPGHPLVVRFPWIPPLALAGGNVALLALCTDDQDPLPALPAGTAIALVTAERRAALHILPMQANPVFIRDGVDDDGRVGSVAWGGRSPDIVVEQVVHANPTADFGADITNRRHSDWARLGNNFIYVRVSNRAAVATPSQVDVWEVAYPSLDRPANWRKLNAAPVAVAVPANSSAFATITPAGAPWVPGAPPAPAISWALVAVVSTVGAPMPDFTGEVRNLDTMWRLLRNGIFSDRVAMRALRFVA